MAFTPTLTPGRGDHLGHMQVPHDVFLHVTRTPGWVDAIADFKPANRQHYLESIKYWMDLNGACIIRSSSSSRFAAIQDIKQCATILYGRQNVDGNIVPPAVSDFTFTLSPLSGTLPLDVTLTATIGANHTADSIEIQFNDGTAVQLVPVTANSTKTVTHTFALGTGPSKDVYVQAKDDGAYVGTRQTKTVTLSNPAVSNYTMSVNPTTGTLPLATVVTLVAGATHNTSTVEINWGDGTAVSSVVIAGGETKTANHTYAAGTGPTKTITSIAKNGATSVGSAKTQVMTLNDAAADFAISATPTTGTAPLATVLTITKGSDASVTKYYVDWGDNSKGAVTQLTQNHTYTAAGTYTLSVQQRTSADANVGSPKTLTYTVS